MTGQAGAEPIVVDSTGAARLGPPSLADLRRSARLRMGRVLTAVRADPVFWLGLAAIVVPTMIGLTQQGWNTEEAGHAPIVFATAIWLFVINAPRARAVARPGSALITAVALGFSLLMYAAARITALPEIQGLATYLTLVAVLYGLGGAPVLRELWFPVVYSLFLVPIPDSFVDIATQPIKIAISTAVVKLLSTLGYPVASSGVSIYIGQFELLIAAACAGLNSLISLTAIGSFYVYLRHNASWRYTLVLMLAIFPIAVFANFIRVLFLVLLTYYAGEAVAQGFLHEFAGLFMLVVALGAIFLIDRAMAAVIARSKASH